MPWPPSLSNPIPGTVITVAYAVANILDPLRWLRQLTGNADPPGSNYVVRSTSTSATVWSKVTADTLDIAAVTNDKLADQSVTNAKVANVTLNGDAKIQPSTITGNASSSAIGAGVIHANRIQPGSFDTTQVNAAFANDAINGAKLVNTTVANGKLAGGITYDKLTPLAPLSSIQGPPLVLTTSNGDLAQITAAVAGLYIVHAHVVLYTTTTPGDINQNLQAWINAPSGIVGTLFRHFTGPTNVDQNAVQAQTALIQLTAGQQVTLRAKKSGGTGSSGANDGTLIAVRLSA